MIKISAVIITKDEEKIIERCLRSLSGLADEIVIVDDKSADKTVDICGKYANTRVIINESKGNFDMQRNIGIEQSSGEWILQLDADEVIPPATANKILEQINSPGHYAAFNLKRRNFFLGKPILNAGNYHYKTKIFRKDKARYTGCSIHETLKVDGEIGNIEADVLHYPFNSIKSYVDRANFYSEVEADVYLKKNKAPSEKYLRHRITWKSIKNFYKLYIKKSGYKDGMHGLIWCLLNVINAQLLWMKIWEKAHKEEKAKRQNILIVRNDRFGEFLLNIPAIRAVKETLKGSNIILAVNPYVKELAAKVPYADEVIVWQNGRHSLSEIIKFGNLLKKKNIDTAIIMNPSKDTNIAVYLASIPERIGYDHKWSFLLTKREKDLKHLGQKHEVEYNLDLVELVSGMGRHCEEARSADEAIPFLEIASLTAYARNDHKWFFNNAIAIHPWTSDPVKQWPEERFRELAQRIINETDLDILIVGSPEELQKSAAFNGLDKRIDNLTGKTTLVELASILKNSKLLVSGDSGPVHLSCAVGTPVIALFRNDMPGKGPKRWGPWGEGNIVIEKNSLLDISVEEVFEKVKALL